PLLDVRSGVRRLGDVRAGGAAAADAAARDRRAGLLAREGQLQRGGRPVVVGRPEQEAESVSLTRRLVRGFDRRTASAPLLRKALRYLFPDHWSFLLGEVALYAFVVLVATGIYLTFFFVDSTQELTYRGPYIPLQGQPMSE